MLGWYGEGDASAADTVPGDLISGSMLLAQNTAAPGGKGGGSVGETGRADKGSIASLDRRDYAKIY